MNEIAADAPRAGELARTGLRSAELVLTTQPQGTARPSFLAKVVRLGLPLLAVLVGVAALLMWPPVAADPEKQLPQSEGLACSLHRAGQLLVSGSLGFQRLGSPSLFGGTRAQNVEFSCNGRHEAVLWERRTPMGWVKQKVVLPLSKTTY